MTAPKKHVVYKDGNIWWARVTPRPNDLPEYQSEVGFGSWERALSYALKYYERWAIDYSAAPLARRIVGSKGV